MFLSIKGGQRFSPRTEKKKKDLWLIKSGQVHND